MPALENQADLTPQAAERQFELDEGLGSARLPDYSAYTSQPGVPLDDAQVRSFLANGFLKLRSTLPPDYHQHVYDGIHRAIGDGRASANPGNNFLPLVPLMGTVFEDPVIRGALTSLLGPGYMMHPHRFCHDNEPGSGRQAWHHDTYWGYLRKVRNHRPWWVMVMYMPQDTPLERGPTGALPGSQHLLRRCPVADRHEVANDGPAGTCMLIHYDIWHHRLENQTELERYMVKFEFTRCAPPRGPTWRCEDEQWRRPAADVPYGLEPAWRHAWHWLGASRPTFVQADSAEAEALAAQLRSGDEAARVAASERLGALGPAALPAVEALELAVADEHEPVSLNAAYALGGAGEPGIDALLRVMRAHDGPNTADPRLFFDEGQEWHIGHPVRSAAHGLVAAGDLAVPGLLALAAEGDELARQYAAFALGEIGNGSAATRERLATLAHDPSTHVRVSAVEALGLIPADDTTTAVLCEVLSTDPDDEVRSNAALSLWRQAPAGAVEALAAALHDGNRYVQGYALEALERVGTAPAMALVLAHLKTARWCPITSPRSMF